MPKAKANPESTAESALMGTALSDLKGRQSVRASFSLTEQCIDAISIVATQMRIKQKSIFENLSEDADGLKSIADEIRKAQTLPMGRIKKTFVISRKALEAINQAAESCSVSRDTIVELSIQRLLPIIDKERKKHALRKAFSERINAHFGEGKKLLDEISRELGKDDPIIGRFSTVMSSYASVKDSIGKFIDRSIEIEDFDSAQKAFD